MNEITTIPEPPQIFLKKEDHDVTLIRQLVSDAERFQNDPDTFVQLLSGDAQLVNVVGFRVDGKDDIHTIMNSAVQTSLSNIITRHELLDIKFLSEDVALVKCVKHILLQKDNQPDEEKAKAVLTFVVIKKSGRWLITYAQNTPIQEQAIENIKKKNINSAAKHVEDHL